MKTFPVAVLPSAPKTTGGDIGAIAKVLPIFCNAPQHKVRNESMSRGRVSLYAVDWTIVKAAE